MWVCSLSLSLPVCLSASLPLCLPLCLSVCLCVCLSVCLCVCVGLTDFASTQPTTPLCFFVVVQNFLDSQFVNQVTLTSQQAHERSRKIEPPTS